MHRYRESNNSWESVENFVTIYIKFYIFAIFNVKYGVIINNFLFYIIKCGIFWYL